MGEHLQAQVGGDGSPGELGDGYQATATGGIRLTPTERHLLEVLAREPGKLVTQEQLLQQVWGPAYITEANYLRAPGEPASQARTRLRTAPLLITEPGIGYRFTPDSSV